MICRLCHAEAKLSNSHVIPEFCYKGLYDEKHRLIDVYDFKNDKKRFRQIGYREHLLCSDCERHFAHYERHCRRLFTDSLPEPRAGTKRFFDLPRLDGFKLRYFLLSILWRASESKDGFFKHVDLGSKHSELLRSHLLADTLPSFDEYGCWALALHFEDKPLKDLIMEPTPSRIEGHKVYRFVFTGIVLFCFISSHPIPEMYRKCLIGSSKSVTIHRADLPELGFLRKTLFGQ